MSARLSARDITLRYGDRVVATRLSLDIPDGAFTAVVGPNACGKSTLLRSLVRLLRPAEGRVELDGREVGSYPSKELARQVGFLPQDPLAPEDVKVRQLVARGRYPHQSLLKLWSERDEDAVTGAMAAAGVTELADRPVQELSGGQRQRVWIAMALAQ
ncbi:ATP-binding cassette domain-containing protein, partial [Streptomyces sp. SID89]|nr:ATP-binding cassette domain-containing protein [Streptomyces sp. SID89]